MSTEIAEEKLSSSLLDRPLTWFLTGRGEIVLYVLLAAIAAATRLWDLGGRALHHDESLHALYSWNLYQGKGYEHHPMMHGPFQFHGTALIYFLFGDSDYTARLLPALFGIAIVTLPYFLRPFLGRAGSLITALFLTISPAFMYYSRFARNDIYISVWNLLLILAIWGYLRERKLKYLYLGAAALSLSFSTKETTYITVLIFGGYLFLMAGREIWSRVRRRVDLSGLSPAGVLTLLFGTLALPQGSAGARLVWEKLGYKVSDTAVIFGGYSQRQVLAAVIVVALVGLSVLIAWRWNISVWARCAIVFYVIYILLFTTFFTNPKGFATGIWGSLDYWIDQQDVRRGEQPWYYFFVLLPLYEFVPLAFGIIAAAYHGFRRRMSALSVASLFLSILAIVLFTGNYFLAGRNIEVRGLSVSAFILLLALATVIFAVASGRRNDSSVVTVGALFVGAVGVLVVILATGFRWRGVDIGSGSLSLAPSFILLALAVLLFVASFPTGQDDFVRFLIFWSGMSLVAYSLAGEKMPWLSLHMALPLILLACYFLGRLWERVDWRALWQRGGGYLIMLALVALLALRAVLGEAAGRAWTIMGLLAVAAFVVAGVALLRQRLRLNQIGPVSLLAVAGLLSLFSFRTAWRASIVHGDTPVEMLIYTQSSPDITRINREVARLAAQTGEGKNLPITVDSENGYSWPWAWYLRDYKKVDYPSLTTMRGEAAGKVLLLAASDQTSAQGYLDKYGPGTVFRHRWWFPEDTYRGLTAKKFWDDLTNPRILGDWWRYFVFRQPKSPLGSSDAIVYFPSDYKPADPMLARQEARPAVSFPQRELTPRLTMGVFGTEPGQLNEPKGVAVDDQGNIYVTDTLNHTLQKFGAGGALIKAVGQKGEGANQFNEPWGVAVDRQGNVYVADTWNHRIQKFDRDLNYLAQWGGLGVLGDAPTGEKTGLFFGPRSIEIDAEGDLYVTDTGNKRVQKFTSAGQFLGVWGGKGSGPGMMSEPVGIAIDAEGNILLADTWNRRIQRFDRNFQPKGQFSVAPAWQGQSILNKPYLAVDRQGNILTTDPLSRRVLRFSPSGSPLSAAGGAQLGTFQLPVGVAVDKDGAIYVADAGKHSVTKFAPFD